MAHMKSIETKYGLLTFEVSGDGQDGTRVCNVFLNGQTAVKVRVSGKHDGTGKRRYELFDTENGTWKSAGTDRNRATKIIADKVKGMTENEHNAENS